MDSHQGVGVSDPAGPAEEICQRILLRAGIQEPSLEVRRLFGGYSTAVYDVGGHYILRIALDERGSTQLSRERVVLDRLRGLQGIAKVVVEGSLAGAPAKRYLLLTQLPGDNLFRLWLDAPRPVQEGY